MNKAFFTRESTERTEKFIKKSSVLSVFSVVSFLLLFAFSSVAAFAQTGSVKGRVRTNKGEGIASVTVSARLKGEDVKSVKSDSKGNFVLDGLDAGIYNIAFEKNGYSTGIRYNVEVKSGTTNDLGDRLILNLDPGTQVIVKGSVFDKNGFGVFNAKIEIQRIGEDGKTKKIGTGYTSESGEFTFKFPEASAKFRVIASAKGAKASKDIEVDSAAIYRLAITLDVERK